MRSRHCMAFAMTGLAQAPCILLQLLRADAGLLLLLLIYADWPATSVPSDDNGLPPAADAA